MAVKKKPKPETDNNDNIHLHDDDPDIQRVRAAIQLINRDEGETVMAATKKPSKKAAAAKEAAPKETAPKKGKKAAAPAAEAAGDENTVTLSSLCEELEIEPVAARRKLRNAKVERGDGRWAWEKDSSALKKVREVLAPAA